MGNEKFWNTVKFFMSEGFLHSGHTALNIKDNIITDPTEFTKEFNEL